MHLVLDKFEREIEEGNMSKQDASECAAKVLELKEQFPEVFSLCAMADKNVLQIIAGASD